MKPAPSTTPKPTGIEAAIDSILADRKGIKRGENKQ